MNYIISNTLDKEWVNNNKPNKKITFCSKYLSLQLTESIINIFKKVFNDESIRIQFIIEDCLVNYLKGDSDLSSIELLNTYSNVSIRSKSNINMNFIMIDEVLLINAFSYKSFEKLFIEDLYKQELALKSIDVELINQCIEYTKDLNDINYIKLVDNYIEHILYINEIELEYKLHSLLFHKSHEATITSNTIPQFSQFHKAVYDTPRCIICSGNSSIDYTQLGKYLLDRGKNDAAYKKYGENHSKFAQLIGFTYIDCNRPRKIHITHLGKEFYNLEPEEQNKLVIYQLFRLDIVKGIAAKVLDDPSLTLEDYLKQYLSNSTVGRRISSIKQIFKYMQDNGCVIAKYLLNKI